MKFKIEIDTDNAAFADGMLVPETQRILWLLSQDMENGRFDADDGKPLYDVNGNKVGSAYFERTAKEQAAD